MYSVLCYVLQYKDGKTPLYPKPSVMFGTQELLSVEGQKGKREEWRMKEDGKSKEGSVLLSQ